MEKVLFHFFCNFRAHLNKFASVLALFLFAVPAGGGGEDPRGVREGTLSGGVPWTGGAVLEAMTLGLVPIVIESDDR